jgi:nitrile hydratase alpha subunit
MNQEQQGKKMGEIIAKCWADEGFKQRLLADANAALKAEGVNVPAGVKVNVLENTDKVINFVLPAIPKSELSVAELDGVAGGGCVDAGSEFEVESRHRCSLFGYLR